ncbi:unnamed protein product [Toxocara canis]|uniref:Transmembrane protein n=1 Tax=Toxocara canis TaxID=6265 RepID=A0A183TXK2_TOXCA|nr:unnamed protein product [Toxocara canis]
MDALKRIFGVSLRLFTSRVLSNQDSKRDNLRSERSEESKTNMKKSICEDLKEARKFTESITATERRMLYSVLKKRAAEQYYEMRAKSHAEVDTDDLVRVMKFNYVPQFASGAFQNFIMIVAGQTFDKLPPLSIEQRHNRLVQYSSLLSKIVGLISGGLAAMLTLFMYDTPPRAPPVKLYDEEEAEKENVEFEKMPGLLLILLSLPTGPEHNPEQNKWKQTMFFGMLGYIKATYRTPVLMNIVQLYGESVLANVFKSYEAKSKLEQIRKEYERIRKEWEFEDSSRLGEIGLSDDADEHN